MEKKLIYIQNVLIGYWQNLTWLGAFLVVERCIANDTNCQHDISGVVLVLVNMSKQLKRTQTFHRNQLYITYMYSSSRGSMYLYTYIAQSTCTTTKNSSKRTKHFFYNSEIMSFRGRLNRINDYGIYLKALRGTLERLATV